MSRGDTDVASHLRCGCSLSAPTLEGVQVARLPHSVAPTVGDMRL